MLALTLVGNPVAMVGKAVTVTNVLSTYILEDTLVKSKTHYYYKKCKTWVNGLKECNCLKQNHKKIMESQNKRFYRGGGV